MPVDLETNLMNLRRDLLALGAKVEEKLFQITDAILNADVAAARDVRNGDGEIDHDDLAIEEECVRLLALATPVTVCPNTTSLLWGKGRVNYSLQYSLPGLVLIAWRKRKAQGTGE